MLENGKEQKSFSVMVRRSLVAIISMVLTIGTVEAQDTVLAVPQSAIEASALPLRTLFGGSLFSTPASTGVKLWQRSGYSVSNAAGIAAPTDGRLPGKIQRITLEQVKQRRSADPVTSPLARLAQLSVEVAKEHRLSVQADYYPKLGATFANLHYTDFLGQVVSIRRPIQGSLTQIPLPLFSQNQTIAAITFTQPITPLFQVYQAVRIARADERIAMAKAGLPIAKNARDSEVEETYFRLLIAQCHLTTAELKLRDTWNGLSYASASSELIRASNQEPVSVDAEKAIVTAGADVKELTALLNRWMGWPEDTKLELVPPKPLVESISLDEVADTSIAANPDVIEAEQNIVKARAASTLSKLEYVPTVAAVSGYLFQNVIPLVPSNFGYGGVIATYNLFDFGKRERGIKEARAHVAMAEMALQMTRAKLADNVKKSYFELERSRQLSQLAQKMGSSVDWLMNVSTAPESIEMNAARAKLEADLLEADLAHRQAYARLKALMGPQREKKTSY